MRLDTEVLDHCARSRKQERLDGGVGRLEELRTREVLSRWLPRARQAAHAGLASVALGDARRLPFADGSADAVLLLARRRAPHLSPSSSGGGRTPRVDLVLSRARRDSTRSTTGAPGGARRPQCARSSSSKVSVSVLV
ncbi:hypothetical protein [Geodermatophilus sp. URMC 63]